MIGFPTDLTKQAVVLIASAWGICACAGQPDLLPPTSPHSTPVAVALQSAPTYLTLVGPPTESILYVESQNERGRRAEAMRLDAEGRPTGDLTLLVDGFDEVLGEVLVTPDGDLLLPMLRGVTDDTVMFELWRWRDRVPNHLAHCLLPPTTHGRVLVIEERLVVAFEGPDGALLGFQTAVDEPECPDESEISRLVEPPLPGGYLIAPLATGFAVAGEVGDSYTVRTFDAALGPVRRYRVAAGSASGAQDFEVLQLPRDGGVGGDVAIFGAGEAGALDVYLAVLPSPFSAAQPEARRVVASADVEREPHVFARGSERIVSWTAETGSGDRLRLAAPMGHPDDPVTRGGEVLSRRAADSGPAAWRWIEAGFLSAETNDTGGLWSVVLSVYEPTFW